MEPEDTFTATKIKYGSTIFVKNSHVELKDKNNEKYMDVIIFQGPWHGHIEFDITNKETNVKYEDGYQGGTVSIYSLEVIE